MLTCFPANITSIYHFQSSHTIWPASRYFHYYVSYVSCTIFTIIFLLPIKPKLPIFTSHRRRHRTPLPFAILQNVHVCSRHRHPWLLRQKWPPLCVRPRSPRSTAARLRYQGNRIRTNDRHERHWFVERTERTGQRAQSAERRSEMGRYQLCSNQLQDGTVQASAAPMPAGICMSAISQ